MIAKEIEDLKNVPQWVCFKLEPDPRPDDPNHKKKPPYNPFTGRYASSTDPNTWGTYNEALAGAKRFNLDGVGFVLTNGYIGIDLDHVIDNEKKTIKTFADDIIKEINSYTEISPSGNGIHIISKTNDGVQIGRKYKDVVPGADLEIYNNGRYFTMTGNVYGIAKPIVDRTEKIQKLYKRYFPEKKSETVNMNEPAYNTESDNDVLTKALNGRNGKRFSQLWQGDTSAYGNDHSRATQALINDLCYWTNGDAKQIDRLFRNSGLFDTMKEEKKGIKKWDIRHGAKTYGEMTIDNALQNFTPYIPIAKQNGNVKPEIATPQEEIKHDTPTNALDYLNGGFLTKDIDHFSKYKDRKTGYSNLDAIQPLYPGLYVLGAISSLGKTTFLHQMGDQIAKSGNPVLFFSLEQNKLEMITKSIARLTAQLTPNDPISAINIRRGVKSQSINQAIEEYKNYAGNMYIIDCNFGVTVEQIINEVKKFIIETGSNPVVIVDYLQIIQPSDQRQNAKDAVDHSVRALKKLQSENDLVLFVIASLNRQNYLTPVDFESFKESGGIEYTADVVMGLQLAIMNDDIFNGDKKLKEKREKVKEAKKANPRKVELVILKNRYGVASYSCGYTYNPVYDLFTPDNVTSADNYNPDKLQSELEKWKKEHAKSK